MPADRPSPRPIFFERPDELRRWLHEHHATAPELWIGYYKKGTGKPSLTWPQTVDEALCYGWIDGIRKSLDGERFMQRLTPRRKRSNWSAVNLKRVPELIAEGRMQPSGLAAFEARDPARCEVYSFENEHATLAPEEEARFRKKAKAWRFWEAQPPGYRRTALHWVTSAKRPETRARRLATLIDDSANGLRIALLRR
ncbi:MAG TPA: YdeI/OmpD-associated family protein [Gemmatimonadaceae bacterium]|nr:YdeI/OmpD-associated family protein [Gemmatimonadaceae bacterium]